MDTFDEFSFLAAQAAELDDLSVPEVHRLELPLDDGRTLSALRWGTAAPAVLFLHGGGLNAHTWDTTILSLGLPALAVDLAGHGDSSWRSDATYTGRLLAGDLVTALETWTDQRPLVVVGQSLGGLTGAALAAARPDLVSHLVLVDITPTVAGSPATAELGAFFAGPTDWASRDELVERALSFGLGGDPAQAARGVFHNSRVRADGRVQWKHHFAHLAAGFVDAPSAASTPATEAATALAQAPAAEGWADLEAVTGDILLIRGDSGYVSPALVDELHTRLPHVQVQTLTAGHNVQEYAPRELAAVIGEVVAR